MRTCTNIVAAGLAGLAVLSVSSSAWGRSVSLDLRDTGAAGRAVAVNSGASVVDGTLRSFDLDAGAADVGEVAVGDELSFRLFDDVSITLTLKEKMPSPLGGDVFLAEAAGYSGVKNAVVLRTAEGLTIDVQDYRSGKVYKVLSTGAGVGVRELDATRTGTCGCGALAPPKFPVESIEKASQVKRATATNSTGTNETFVDVLVAYDAGAASWAK